ncbi:MAG: hypothetical protein IJ730_03320 [Alphaproteobacteria bacterium]|nr:hypothetical protein [Alphaproteobacteria bacterium]
MKKLILFMFIAYSINSDICTASMSLPSEKTNSKSADSDQLSKLEDNDPLNDIEDTNQLLEIMDNEVKGLSSDLTTFALLQKDLNSYKTDSINIMLSEFNSMHIRFINRYINPPKMTTITEKLYQKNKTLIDELTKRLVKQTINYIKGSDAFDETYIDLFQNIFSRSLPWVITKESDEEIQQIQNSLRTQFDKLKYPQKISILLTQQTASKTYLNSLITSFEKKTYERCNNLINLLLSQNINECIDNNSSISLSKTAQTKLKSKFHNLWNDNLKLFMKCLNEEMLVIQHSYILKYDNECSITTFQEIIAVQELDELGWPKSITSIIPDPEIRLQNTQICLDLETEIENIEENITLLHKRLEELKGHITSDNEPLIDPKEPINDLISYMQDFKENAQYFLECLQKENEKILQKINDFTKLSEKLHKIIEKRTLPAIDNSYKKSLLNS